MYDRVCNDYKYYLAEQCIYGEAQNTSYDEDQEIVVDSKKNATGIGVVLLVIGVVIFPMIVWSIGKHLENTAFASTIITYAGSIIGGGITLAGVYITIAANNRQRREDLTLQYIEGEKDLKDLISNSNAKGKKNVKRIAARILECLKS